MEVTPTEDTGTTQAQSEELVDIEQASDEDLDAYLDQHNESNASEPVEESEPVEAQENLPATERPKQDPKPETKQPAQEPDRELTPEEKESRYQKIIAEQKERLEKTELWAKHRSNEIGDLRKQLREANAKLAQGLDDRALENPRQAINDQLAIRENEAHLQSLDQEEATIQHAVRAQKVVAHFIKPEEMPTFDEMSQALEADGLDQNYIGTFRSNPYLSMYPETLVHLAKRTAVEKALRHLVGYTKGLLAENEKLKGEVKSRPTAVLKRVEAELKKTPAMSAANGGSAVDAGGPSGDPSTWSEEQLDEFLKNAS